MNRGLIRTRLFLVDAGGEGGSPPDPGTDPGQPTEPEAAPEPKPTETVDYWKRKSRENEARAKANADAAKRLTELEDREKTEQQRAAEALAAAERAAQEARAEAVRYRAAAEHGVTGDDIDLLGDGDTETVTTRAERLGALLAAERELADIKARQSAGPPGHQRPALRPGAAPADTTGTPSSVDAAAAAAARRGLAKPTQ